MFFSTLLIAAGLLVAETPDTLQAVTIVADKGVVVSRTDTLALRADGTAAQALLRFPGLSISDYGGLAGLKSVSLRGLGTAHTDIYLDGVRVSNFQSGQNDLGMLPMETLGSAVVEYYSSKAIRLPDIRILGLPDAYVTHGSVAQLKADCHIDKDSLIRSA